MTDNEVLQVSECESKQGYKTKRKATLVYDSMLKRKSIRKTTNHRATRLHIYLCPFCGCFHLGNAIQ